MVVVPDAVGVGVGVVTVGDGVTRAVGVGVGVGRCVLGVEGVVRGVLTGGRTTEGEPAPLLGVRVAVTEDRCVVGRALVGVGDVVTPGCCPPGLLPPWRSAAIPVPTASASTRPKSATSGSETDRRRERGGPLESKSATIGSGAVGGRW